MMSGVQFKNHKRYWFYRIYCLTVVIYGVAMSYEISRSPDLDFGILFDSYYKALLYPLVIPAMFMWFSWAVFPWDYSIFGKLERTPLPEETPILEQKYSWGYWGHWMSRGIVLFITWRVYRTGLGISILGAGTVFIPSVNFLGLEESGVIFSAYKLKHNSQEVRSPMTLGGRRVFEALKAI